MTKRTTIPKKVEKELFQEAGSRCLICGNNDVSVLTIHHIIPFSEKPEHDPRHMLVLCANCHAKADRGELTKETLYAAKSKVRSVIPFPGRKRAVDHLSVSGDANVVAGRDINIAGGVHIKVSKGKKSTQSMIFPGTVGEDPRMVGYLNYLIKRYNEFKEWECDKKGERMNYPLIRIAYEREIKYKVKDTPRELFDRAAEYLQGRIENTKLGRIKKKQGQKLFSSFNEFDKSGRID